MTAHRPDFQACHLSLRYGQVQAFEDVSLRLPGGSITALVGPSGSGKTSFLRSLNRLTDLVEGCHLSGALHLGEEDLLAPDLDVTAHRRRVGMIFQKPNPFPFSIWRNLLLPLEEHGIGANQAERKEIGRQALEDVGLWKEVADRLEAPARNLSGGQQQRLCVARALCLKPEVLLLDEPTASLDPLSASVVEDLVARLNGAYTLVLVTHNLAQARRLANRVAVFWQSLGAGRLIEDGAVEEIFENPRDALTQEYIRGSRG